MKKISYCFLILILFTQCQTQKNGSKNENLTDYVNLHIGTDGEHKTEYGGMIPGVTKPFGMTQWTAMTRENDISKCPYHYQDDKIIGFTGTHQPAIWMSDYGYVSLMPQIDNLQIKAQKRGYKFQHKDEIAKPHYYSVPIVNNSDTVFTEITATTRCSFFQFHFPENKTPILFFEISRLENYEGFVKIIPEKNQIVGYNPDRQNKIYGRNMGPELKNFKGYFVIQLNQKIENFGVWSDTSFVDSIEDKITIKEQETTLKGNNVGAFIRFKAQNTDTIQVKIATSFISIEQAQKNLNQEIAHWNFDKTKKETQTEWENYLSRITIEGATPDQKINFYTSMYHTLLYPRIFSEYGKYYSAFDDTVHNGVSYNDYSLWDTFRALHPLLLFTAPEHVNPMITSLLQMYDQGGWLPKWPNPTYTNIMIGTHADAVIADAYIKGFRNFDAEKAYKAMYKNAMTPPEGDSTKRWADRAGWTSYEARGGLHWYKKLGYVPVDKTNESVARTLEFAYGDYCVAQMAKALNKKTDYDFFMKRSKNYKNVFDPNTGFMQPKLADGTFFNKEAGFTEGSKWTYLFCVMQDIPGLIELMGGKQKFTQKLDENFDSLHYRHDNEPGHHYIYLYNFIEQPHKAQEKIRQILSEKYKNTPDGLCGNDDCGQMSAWYIFSSLGFYPVTPGSDEYAIGTPLFSKAVIKLQQPYFKNKQIEIIAKNCSEKNNYVKSISIDGKPLKKPFIKHEQLINAQKIVFEMSDNHSK